MTTSCPEIADDNHVRLAAYASPLGPMPSPTAADRTEAETWLREVYADSPVYLANNWDRLAPAVARTVMHRRMHAEHKAIKAHRRAA